MGDKTFVTPVTGFGECTYGHQAVHVVDGKEVGRGYGKSESEAHHNAQEDSNDD